MFWKIMIGLAVIITIGTTMLAVANRTQPQPSYPAGSYSNNKSF